MKLKRMEEEQKADRERRKKERLMEKKDMKAKEFNCSPCDLTFPTKVRSLPSNQNKSNKFHT